MKEFRTVFRCNPAESSACSGKIVSDSLAVKAIVECDHFDLSPCDRCDCRFRGLCRRSNPDISATFSFAGGGGCGTLETTTDAIKESLSFPGTPKD